MQATPYDGWLHMKPPTSNISAAPERRMDNFAHNLVDPWWTRGLLRCAGVLRAMSQSGHSRPI